MNPLFFGDSQNPLFGIYHPPAGKENSQTAVLLCYPQAREYEITHWAIRQLAGMMVKAGSHVLRFDYSGTGDSAGDYDSVSLEKWKSDIQIAIDELKDTAWVKKVSLVGLRLGATLAALTAEEIEVENLILWDPVVNGNDYIKELRNVQDVLSTHLGLSTASNGTNGNRPDGLLGYPSPPGLESSIEEIDLTNNFRTKAEKTFLIVSQENPGYLRLRDHLMHQGISFEYRLAPDNGNWGNTKENWQIFFAQNILQAITESVTGIES